MHPFPTNILGIETSCDETAAAILHFDNNGNVKVLANVIHTQQEEHAGFGGVVPELAARAHVELVDTIVERTLEEAGMADFSKLDAVAATAGPGLIGGVMVGMMTAKAIALSHTIPFIPVNHLEGHALSVRLTDDVDFPYLLLLVSGGHTQLVLVEGVGAYTRIGTTIDDAAGEAFDKTAKLLGLGQPGGPKVETAAKTGDPLRFPFPRPLHDRATSEFSFSGLKTAVRQAAEALQPLTEQDVSDLCASFQYAAARHLADKTKIAMEATNAGQLVIAGGVAANQAIRDRFIELTNEAGWKMVVPPAKYCTDNGAMIALAGAEYIRKHGTPEQSAAFSLGPKARWPLDSNPGGLRYGGGKKGPKA